MTDIIGYTAAVIGTSLMLPQVIKSLRTKSVQDLSWIMLILYFFNGLLWNIYGYMLSSWPMIICNTIALAISIFQFGLKVKYEKRQENV